MSNSRKTQGEIDKLLKKINEGMDAYEDTYERFQGAGTTSLKDKNEAELKKEIKKLQRLREQIKVLFTSNEVKDRKALEKAKKDIEIKMEAFKGVERETKTKAFSKEGLSSDRRMDPANQAKHDTSTWIRDAISELSSQIESLEFDIENEGGGNRKKKATHYDPREERLSRQKFHVVKLEQLLRLMDNDELTPDDIDAIQQDVQTYVEQNGDDDFIEEIEDLYDCFDLPEASYTGKRPDSDDDEPPVKASPKTQKAAEVKKAEPPKTPSTTGGTVIQPETPPTSKATPKTPAAAVPAKKDIPVPASKKAAAPEPVPAKKTTAAPQPAGTVKQPAAAPKPATPASPARETLNYAAAAQAAAEKNKPATPSSQVKPVGGGIPQMPAAPVGLDQGPDGGLTLEDLDDDDAGLNDDTFGDDAMGDASGGGMADLAGMTAGTSWTKPAAPLPPQPAAASAEKPANGSKTSTSSAAPSGPPLTPAQTQAAQQQAAAHNAAINMLEQSAKNLPHPNDCERLKPYIPPNPYKTPAWYPQNIHSSLTHPETLAKFEIEALFFIFYYQPNTYQQYLAAKELKKQSWRYHKKYLTWFQRHDTPKQTTDDFEQGAYIYFDFESGWCQRIKNDFTFKYQFLEDELQ